MSILTRREEEVVLLRMESLRYREIADQLGVSDKTVAALPACALQKLQRAAWLRSTMNRPPSEHVSQVPDLRGC